MPTSSAIISVLCSETLAYAHEVKDAVFCCASILYRCACVGGDFKFSTWKSVSLCGKVGHSSSIEMEG